MVLKEVNWWMLLKELNGLERSQLINGLEKNQLINDLERSQLINGLERTWWSLKKSANKWSWKNVMVLKECNGLDKNHLINGLEKTQWSWNKSNENAIKCTHFLHFHEIHVFLSHFTHPGISRLGLSKERPYLMMTLNQKPCF